MRFSVTFDYLCPFARNACEHIVTALEAGAGWEVRFLPFSLAQVHVEEGQPPVWDQQDPWQVSGLLALAAGVAVRDHLPDRFLAAHRSLFAARHDDGRDIRDREVVADALRRAGVDPDAVWPHLDAALDTVRKEHEAAAAEHTVWGVPTFIGRERAVFVRLMDRPRDADHARRTIERVLDLVDGWPELNEFKQTVIPR